MHERQHAGDSIHCPANGFHSSTVGSNAPRMCNNNKDREEEVNMDVNNACFKIQKKNKNLAFQLFFEEGNTRSM